MAPIFNEAPTPTDAARIQSFKEAFHRLEREILEFVAENRERALALTNLEQSSMWLTKAILEG